MTHEVGPVDEAKPAKRALLGSSLFYVLIAFEFFYMATPFGAYFYAVYGPGLNWLQASEPMGWLIQFFMPHVVAQTRSPLINAHEYVGALLFLAGLVGFAVGAFQIYRAKLRRSDAVMGGVYRYVRHPQYLALMVSSIGMLLLWPRYLVLILTVTVIFIYGALAKAEEGWCLRQFPGYADYMKRTGMFLPKRLSPSVTLLPGKSRWARTAVWALSYVAVLAGALAAAAAVRTHALSALYTLSTPDGHYLSVVEIGDRDFAAAVEIARSAPEAQAALSGHEAILGYVVPTEMYISEIPMRLPAGERFGHSVPHDRDPARYKIIFTRPIFVGDERPATDRIIGHAVNKMPLAEVHVNLDARTVTATFPPPEQAFYEHRQVPLF